MKNYKENPNNKWSQTPPLARRWNSFWVYQICSFWALFQPEEVDTIILEELSDQYIEISDENS